MFTATSRRVDTVHLMTTTNPAGTGDSSAATPERLLERWRTVAESELEVALTELRDLLTGEPALLAEFERVSFVVRDDAPEDEPDLLGMYLGPTNAGDDSMQLPPLVELYLLPLLDAATPEHLEHLDPDLTMFRDELRITVRHELAHHLGMEHDRMHDLGIA